MILLTEAGHFITYSFTLQLLSQAYTKLTINNTASASASALAEQANFWDPPSKSDQSTPPLSTSDEGIQNLLK